MRFPLVFALIMVVFSLGVDTFIYRALQRYCKGRFWPRVQLWSSLLLLLIIIAVICMPKMGGGNVEFLTLMWMLFGYLSVYVPKLIFVIFDLLSRLPRLWHRPGWRPVSWTGFGLAVCIFLVLWWSALFNRYRVQIVEQTVEIENLPQAFDGLTIAQISDLHVGTFGRDTSFASKLVREINALHPDVVVFTGDIVNRHSSELDPFVKTLSGLKAPMGVYSIMGNHDYGDYSVWKSPADKNADVRRLQAMQKEMGWQMLNNETKLLDINGQKLALIGVENVGDPPFHTYGSLTQAYSELADSMPKILLSHNPAHWNAEIADKAETNVALTLSGHTHAMQVEIFGLSPAVFRYKTWGGMYADTLGRKLYVNIGAGEVGFPARIGATPEITLFTLKK